MHEIIRPYQSVFFQHYYNLKLENKLVFQSIDFSTTHTINYKKQNDFNYYYAGNKSIKHNETVIFAYKLLRLSEKEIIQRLYQQYKSIYIDEAQDLAGTDIEIVKMLIDSKINVTLVCDPKQATFSTHNERKNKGQSGKNISVFFKNMEKLNKLKIIYQQKSRRFGNTIACLANKIDPSGESLTGSDLIEKKEHEGIFFITKDNLEYYCQKFNPQILVNTKNTAAKLPNNLSGLNFGNSKGLTFDDVVIIPPTPLKRFLLLNENLKSPTKYYIAVTRARHSICFVVNNPEKYCINNSSWKIWNNVPNN